MRAYEYRAWDKESKCMVEVNSIHFPLGKPSGKDITAYNKEEDYYEWIYGYELMQYTGIKDKNGVKIFENDILKCKLYSGKYENYKVSWNEKEGMFEALNKFNTNFIDYTMWNEFEIVGNIYEI